MAFIKKISHDKRPDFVVVRENTKYIHLFKPVGLDMDPVKFYANNDLYLSK